MHLPLSSSIRAVPGEAPTSRSRGRGDLLAGWGQDPQLSASSAGAQPAEIPLPCQGEQQTPGQPAVTGVRCRADLWTETFTAVPAACLLLSWQRGDEPLPAPEPFVGSAAALQMVASPLALQSWFPSLSGICFLPPEPLRGAWSAQSSTSQF